MTSKNLKKLQNHSNSQKELYFFLSITNIHKIYKHYQHSTIIINLIDIKNARLTINEDIITQSNEIIFFAAVQVITELEYTVDLA